VNLKQGTLATAATRMLAANGTAIVVSGTGGSGRSNALRRIAHEARRAGRPTITVGSPAGFLLIEFPSCGSQETPTDIVAMTGEAGLADIAKLAYECGTEPGVVVVLDDLHELDDPTARQLRSLVMVVGSRMSVAASVRSDRQGTASALRLIDALEHTMNAEQVCLPPWSPDDITTWIEANHSVRLLPSSAATLAEWCAGRPAWIVELLRSMLTESGDPRMPMLIESGEFCRLGVGLDDMAGCLAPTLARRLRLEPGTRTTVVRLLAWSGGLTHGLLVAAAQRLDIDAPAALDALDELLDLSLAVATCSDHLRMVNPLTAAVAMAATALNEQPPIRHALWDAFTGCTHPTTTHARLGARLIVDKRQRGEIVDVRLATTIAERLLPVDPQAARTLAAWMRTPGDADDQIGLLARLLLGDFTPPVTGTAGETNARWARLALVLDRRTEPTRSTVGRGDDRDDARAQPDHEVLERPDDEIIAGERPLDVAVALLEAAHYWVERGRPSVALGLLRQSSTNAWCDTLRARRDALITVASDGLDSGLDTSGSETLHADDGFWTLRPFDREIALLVAAGRTNAEAAAALSISLSAVSSRLKRMYRELGIHTRTELSRRIPRHVLP
jgi:DNA-binding CsgD family transcriptional regulator